METSTTDSLKTATTGVNETLPTESLDPRPDTSPKIILYAFEKAADTPSPSGFCQKLEFFFRFANLTYEQKDTLPFIAPKGKLPYVDINDKSVADSQFIIRYMKNEGMVNLEDDAGLSDVEKADSVAYRNFWEEMIYPAVVRQRWFLKENRVHIVREAFGNMPFFIRIPFAWWFNRHITSRLKGHGVGIHTDSEVEIIIREAYDGLEARLLSAKQSTRSPIWWFHGAKGPSEIDATIAGLAINILVTDSNPFPKTLVLEKPSIREYTLRLVQQYFPEYVEIISQLEEAEKKYGQRPLLNA